MLLAPVTPTPQVPTPHGYHTEAEALSSGGFWAKVTKPGLATPCTPYQDKLGSAKLPQKKQKVQAPPHPLQN